MIGGGQIKMNEQQRLARRIESLRLQKGISYYTLSYQSAVPLSTIMHIVDCTTKNPGLFTIMKICCGLGVSVKEFFDAKEFVGIEFELE